MVQLLVPCGGCGDRFAPAPARTKIVRFTDDWFDHVIFRCPQGCDSNPWTFLVALWGELYAFCRTCDQPAPEPEVPWWLRQAFFQQFQFIPFANPGLGFEAKRRLVTALGKWGQAS